mgnify:CR=1 FL=1
MGDGEDGVYVNVGSDGHQGWYYSLVVDCNSAAFTSTTTLDEGPFNTEQDALAAGRFAAMDWCMANGVVFDDEDEA